VGALVSLFWTKTEGVRLAITSRPRGWDWLENDIRLLRREGVDVIVSALTQGEAVELALADEGECCRHNGIEFLNLPIEDRSVPSSVGEFSALITSLIEYLDAGKAVAVHCRAAIGRSSMIAPSVLIQRGVPLESAFRLVEEARGCAVPDTPEQRQWVERKWRSFGGRANKGR